jgi:hypothetical protein
MKLNVKACAIAAGILWGAAVFVLTLLAAWRGTGQHLGLLGSVYFGYQISYLGSIIGLVYGCVSGGIAGALFACLYNKLVKEG